MTPTKDSDGNWGAVCQTLGVWGCEGAGGGWVGQSTSKSLCLAGGAVAQQVPVQAIQVHQAPQQASPSRDSSTDLTQTSSSGTGIALSLLNVETEAFGLTLILILKRKSGGGGRVLYPALQ